MKRSLFGCFSVGSFTQMACMNDPTEMCLNLVAFLKDYVSVFFFPFKYQRSVSPIKNVISYQKRKTKGAVMSQTSLS